MGGAGCWKRKSRHWIKEGEGSIRQGDFLDRLKLLKFGCPRREKRQNVVKLIKY